MMDKKLKKKKTISILTGIAYCVAIVFLTIWGENRENQISPVTFFAVGAFFLYAISALRWYIAYTNINPKATYLDWVFMRRVKDHPEINLLAFNAYKWIILLLLTFIGTIIRLSTRI